MGGTEGRPGPLQVQGAEAQQEKCSGLVLRGDEALALGEPGRPSFFSLVDWNCSLHFA